MKILLSAYIAQNLGDDLFVKLLCNRYKHCLFFIVCDNPYVSSFTEINNLHIIRKFDDLPNIDLQIIVGGSIFMQSNNKSIEEKLKYDKARRYSETTPVYIIGANFGPYKDKQFPCIYRDFFENIDFTVFRDKQSYKLFNLPNMSWAPDLLFNYKLPHVVSSHKIVISCIKKTNRSGLNNYNETKYYSKIIEIIEFFVETGKQVMLSAFCVSEGDEIAAYEILSALSNKAKQNTEIISYIGNSDEFLSKYLSADIIIGTRFHSIILGLNARIPTIPIVYNDKTVNALKSYGFKNELIRIQSIYKYDMCSILENSLNETIDVNIENIREQAVGQFSKLDQVIKE